MNWLAPFYLCVCTAAKTFSGPQDLGELAEKVFDEQEKPVFTPLPGWRNIGVAHNDTAILKIMDLDISHYPVKKGRVTFNLLNLLTKDLPKGSTMEVFSYVNGETLFEGTVDICRYLAFGQLDCPLKAYTEPTKTQQVLQVPENAEDSRLSFIVMVNTPNKELVAEIAGLVDLVQDGSFAEEEEYVFHEEL